MDEKESSSYFTLLDFFSLLLVAYFFVLSWLLPISIRRVTPQLLIPYLPPLLVDKLLLPILFSFCWFLVISQERERLVRAILIFKKIITRLSPFQKVFYSLNFFIIFSLLILPIVSIGLAFFLLFYLPWLVAKSRFLREFKKLSILLATILFLVLGFFTFIPIIELTYFLIRGWLCELFFLWINPMTIKIIHGISLSIGSAGSVTSFFFFVYEGAQEYDPEIEIPYFRINFGGFLLAIILSFVTVFSIFYFPPVFSNFLILLSVLVIIYSFEKVLRWIKGLSRDKNPLGKASLLLFFLLSLAGLAGSRWIIGVLRYLNIVSAPMFLKIGSMLSATIIFFFTYLFALAKASD